MVSTYRYSTTVSTVDHAAFVILTVFAGAVSTNGCCAIDSTIIHVLTRIARAIATEAHAAVVCAGVGIAGVVVADLHPVAHPIAAGWKTIATIAGAVGAGLPFFALTVAAGWTTFAAVVRAHHAVFVRPTGAIGAVGRTLAVDGARHHAGTAGGGRQAARPATIGDAAASVDTCVEDAVRLIYALRGIRTRRLDAGIGDAHEALATKRIIEGVAGFLGRAALRRAHVAVVAARRAALGWITDVVPALSCAVVRARTVVFPVPILAPVIAAGRRTCAAVYCTRFTGLAQRWLARVVAAAWTAVLRTRAAILTGVHSARPVAARRRTRAAVYCTRFTGLAQRWLARVVAAA